MQELELWCGNVKEEVICHWYPKGTLLVDVRYHELYLHICNFILLEVLTRGNPSYFAVCWFFLGWTKACEAGSRIFGMFLLSEWANFDQSDVLFLLNFLLVGNRGLLSGLRPSMNLQKCFLLLGSDTMFLEIYLQIWDNDLKCTIYFALSK